MKLWQKCPICNGAGVVIAGFYDREGFQQFLESSNTVEKCRTCKGTGLIETPSQDEEPVLPWDESKIIPWQTKKE